MVLSGILLAMEIISLFILEFDISANLKTEIKASEKLRCWHRERQRQAVNGRGLGTGVQEMVFEARSRFHWQKMECRV